VGAEVAAVGAEAEAEAEVAVEVEAEVEVEVEVEAEVGVVGAAEAEAVMVAAVEAVVVAEALRIRRGCATSPCRPSRSCHSCGRRRRQCRTHSRWAPRDRQLHEASVASTRSPS
jgi:hypothetical protein